MTAKKDTLSFCGPDVFAIGEKNRGNPLKVFDWDKAARIIKDKNAKHAEAGLAGDWSCTGGEIWFDGEPNKESYTYLASTWAIPTLIVIDQENHVEEFECWLPEKETAWDSGTKWPESSLNILNEK